MAENKKNSYIDYFLHNLKILIKEVSAFLPDDPNLYRLNKRVMFIINADPLYSFNKVGSYLYKYKDFIYDSTTEELLVKWNFVEVYNENDKELEDVSIMIISELQKCMKAMDKQHKDYYRNMVASILDSYIEYITYDT